MLDLTVTGKRHLGLFGEGLAVKLAFTLRPNASHAKVSRNSTPSRANNKCKDSEMGMGLAYLKI